MSIRIAAYGVERVNLAGPVFGRHRLWLFFQPSAPPGADGCALALRYDTASVCIMPYYLKRCAQVPRWRRE